MAKIRFNLLVRWLLPNREHTCWFNFSILDVRVVLIDVIRPMISRLPESRCLRIKVFRSLMRLSWIIVLCCGGYGVGMDGLR